MSFNFQFVYRLKSSLSRSHASLRYSTTFECFGHCEACVHLCKAVSRSSSQYRGPCKSQQEEHVGPDFSSRSTMRAHDTALPVLYLVLALGAGEYDRTIMCLSPLLPFRLQMSSPVEVMSESLHAVFISKNEPILQIVLVQYHTVMLDRCTFRGAIRRVRSAS